MPVYPLNKTYRGGFYHNKKDANGTNDRVYGAEDLRKPYNVIYTDGIKPDADGMAGDNLKVSALDGLKISVAAGFAQLGGAWFENESAYIITLDTANAADRYDCVIIRNDDNESVREPSIYIKSLSAIPTINNLTREGGIYEICVAYVRVPALATGITGANIVDTRTDGALCNVMSGVGATVIRTYRNTYFSETTNQALIPIGIPQFNRSKDELTVIVEGRVFTEGANYTVNNNEQITLSIGLPVTGTRIDFEVRKNVNAAGAETVVQEVAELRKEMTAANRKLEYDYYCNGVNDNVLIGDIVRAYLSGGTDYGSIRLNIIGTLGMSIPAKGSGTNANPYVWFNFGVESNRKAILDFTRCGQITAPIINGSYSYIFQAYKIHVIGANVLASNTVSGTTTRLVETFSNSAVIFEYCRIWINGYVNCMLSTRGTFRYCRGSVANVTENSYCFLPSIGGVVKIDGGEYYAYTGDSTKQSAIVGQSGADSVSILYGVSAPTSGRTGFYQTNSLLQWTGGGIMNCTDLISALPLIVVAGISNIRGTITMSKPNLI